MAAPLLVGMDNPQGNPLVIVDEADSMIELEDEVPLILDLNIMIKTLICKHARHTS
jgi:hypothetical protein